MFAVFLEGLDWFDTNGNTNHTNGGRRVVMFGALLEGLDWFDTNGNTNYTNRGGVF
jgi:hypothetical protein